MLQATAIRNSLTFEAIGPLVAVLAMAPLHVGDLQRVTAAEARPIQDKQITPEVIVAWKNAGARVSWWRPGENASWQRVADDKANPDGLVEFQFETWQDGVVAKLPVPAAFL